MYKRQAYIGVPNGLENGMFQLGKIMVLSMVASFGTASIAANAVSNILATFQVLPGLSVGMAVITVCSRCVGAEDYDMARFYTRKIVKLVHLLTFLFTAIILLVLPVIMYLYNLSPEAMEYTRKILWWHGVIGILIWPEAFTLPNTLRAASDVKFCMILSIISMWVFRIGFSYILGVKLGMGVFGVWVAMTIDWVVRAVLFIIRYKGHRWEHSSIT